MFLRVDIDFPYPRQTENYLNILFGLRFKNYLEDSKTLCRLLNRYNVTATWFPTILVIPDRELLDLLDEGGMRKVASLYGGKARSRELEKEVRREIRFYAIHGTGTLINKLLWRRFRHPSIESKELVCVRDDINFDKLCYRYPPSEILKMFKKLSPKTMVVTHPTYMNRKSILSKKGPTSETFSFLLKNGVRFEKIRIEE